MLILTVQLIWLGFTKLIRSDRAVVLLPCCKTHQYGGHFTLSLKLGVGLVPKSRRNEMHGGDIRSLIGDINYGFTPDLIVMDALEAFITGGPDFGTLAAPGLMLASTDRIAIDAVAVAVLRLAGATSLDGRKIFEQEQIARAVELGLGAASPDEITLLCNNDAIIADIRGVLDEA